MCTRDEEDNIELSEEETYQENENPIIIPYEANKNLDNVPLYVMGLGEEVEDDFLNNEDEDKDEDEDEDDDDDDDDDEDEDKDKDDSMDVDD